LSIKLIVSCTILLIAISVIPYIEASSNLDKKTYHDALFANMNQLDVRAVQDSSFSERPATMPEEGVWLFTGCDTILHKSEINETLARNINTIYFSALGNNCGWNDPVKVSNYHDFINYARSKGMRVFAVTLEDPKYVNQNYQELMKTFGGFISKTKNIFDTYIIDVEPQDVKGSDPKMYLPQYINMSKSLRQIADQYGVKYIDTVPPWFHAKLKTVGIKNGLNALSSHSINLMDYFNTTQKVIRHINDIRSEVTRPYVVSIKVTKGLNAPQLEGQEIPNTISTLKKASLPTGLFEIEGVLKLPKKLFP
jgi:hypothetical protein